jgi:hypothetical protein
MVVGGVGNDVEVVNRASFSPLVMVPATTLAISDIFPVFRLRQFSPNNGRSTGAICPSQSEEYVSVLTTTPNILYSAKRIIVNRPLLNSLIIGSSGVQGFWMGS